MMFDSKHLLERIVFRKFSSKWVTWTWPAQVQNWYNLKKLSYFLTDSAFISLKVLIECIKKVIIFLGTVDFWLSPVMWKKNCFVQNSRWIIYLNSLFELEYIMMLAWFRSTVEGNQLKLNGRDSWQMIHSSVFQTIKVHFQLFEFHLNFTAI